MPDAPTGLSPLIPLADIQAARRRIAGKVRLTPMLAPGPMKTPIPGDGRVVLKLECLQVTGSFKARGASSKLGLLTAAQVKRGIITASGGNHGIAVAYAGWMAGVPTTIYVPEGVSPLKAEKIKGWGARLVLHGRHWNESNEAALKEAGREGLTYFHPFADAGVIAGQGTLALEILGQDPAIDTFLVAIGGGGLIAGMASAVKAVKPSARVIGVEPVGAPTLHASLKAGKIVTLPAITTSVLTMAAQATERINFDIARQAVDDVVLITDDDMREAAKVLWMELGVAADLSGAAALAAILAGKYLPQQGERVCALVCGAGADGVGP
ncbi:MAG: pyridoxal-phosphate dependent enzyme [Alphaproteobacteria bacterium]|nr:pyridoxal-phosphate dependent enzyme [Alphaproteobacteria bacterium]